MRTSDPAIWAVGDAVEISDVVTASAALIPLAGPANRQARIAAASIAGRSTEFRGVQGTAVCGVLGLTIASTGASEKSLRRAGLRDFQAVYLHPGHHVGYYPGAKPIHLKLLFRPSDGRVLGAQAVGEAGVERRIDTIAMAIQMRATVDDLAEAIVYTTERYENTDFNIGNGIETSVLELAERIWRLCGRKEPFQVKNVPSYTYDVQRRVPDVSKILATGWRPKVNLEEGLALTLEWIKEREAISQ
jgi:nucleoside-diphosphate-sugar epimerase